MLKACSLTQAGNLEKQGKADRATNKWDPLEEEEEGYKGCSSSYAAKGPQFLRDTAGKGRDRPSKANPQKSLLRTLSVPSDFETTVMYTEGLCGR